VLDFHTAWNALTQDLRSAHQFQDVAHRPRLFRVPRGATAAHADANSLGARATGSPKGQGGL